MEIKHAGPVPTGRIDFAIRTEFVLISATLIAENFRWDSPRFSLISPQKEKKVLISKAVFY